MNAKDLNDNDESGLDTGSSTPKISKTNETEALVGKLAAAVTTPDPGTGPTVDNPWRTHCFEGRKTFPSGVTYLSQLMAHDLTKSANLDNDISVVSTKPATNLRKNQLLLDTLYGAGPAMAPDLYTGKRVGAGNAGIKFRLLELENSKKGLVKTVPTFALQISGKQRISPCHSVLADHRNSDNPIVMRMATMLMMYHNHMVEQAMETPGQSNDDMFLEARIKTTLAWHKIIRRDIIDQVCMTRKVADFNSRLTTAMAKKPEAMEIDFLHGVLRSFHSLPLPKYVLSQTTTQQVGNIRALVSSRAVAPDAVNLSHPENLPIAAVLQTWQNNWDVDLAQFLDTSADAPNRTAFTPSYAFDFQKNLGASEVSILLRDQKSSAILGVSKISNPLYRGLIAKCRELSKQLKDELPGAYNLPDPKKFPLHVALLAEAYVDAKTRGTLGKIGSVMFSKMTEQKIKAAQAILARHRNKATIKAWYDEAPKSFMDLAREVAPDQLVAPDASTVFVSLADQKSLAKGKKTA